MPDIYNDVPTESDEDVENALGLNTNSVNNNQARESVQNTPGQPQSNGQPQQSQQQAPNINQGQPATNNVNSAGAQEVQNNNNTVSGQPEAQNQAPQQSQQGEPESESEIAEEKITNIRQKFGNDRENILNGIVNIGQKLGKNVDTTKIQGMSTEELINQYALAEQELGSRANQNGNQQSQQNPDVQQLQNQIQQYQQYIQNMQNGFVNQNQSQPQQQQGQNVNNQRPRDNKGRFVPQNNNQNAQQTQQNAEEDIMNDLELDDYDIDKMYDDPNYMKDYLGNQIKKAMGKVDNVVSQRVEQRLQSEKQKQAQAAQVNQMTKELQQRTENVKNKLGENDFEKYRGVARQIIQANPYLVQQKKGIDPKTGQMQMDGLELAFNMAKNMMGEYNSQQQATQQYNQQNQRQKQVANMPNSSARTPGQPQDPNQELLSNALGL